MSEKEKSEPEHVTMSPDADLNVHISVGIFEKALRKSQTYWEIIKPRMDVGRFIESLVKDKKQFYIDFYTTEPKNVKELMKLIKKYRRKKSSTTP